MHRPTLVFVIELQLHRQEVAHSHIRSFPNLTVQIDEEGPVTHRHQIDAPKSARLATDQESYRHRSTPILLQLRSYFCANQQVRIDSIDLDSRAETNHCNSHELPVRIAMRPRYSSLLQQPALVSQERFLACHFTRKGTF